MRQRETMTTAGYRGASFGTWVGDWPKSNGDAVAARLNTEGLSDELRQLLSALEAAASQEERQQLRALLAVVLSGGAVQRK